MYNNELYAQMFRTCKQKKNRLSTVCLLAAYELSLLGDLCYSCQMTHRHLHSHFIEQGIKKQIRSDLGYVFLVV